MKVSVEIPEGKYCNGCLFVVFDPQLDVGSEHCCVYLKYETMKQDRTGVIKHPDCPSLKQEVISTSNIKTQADEDRMRRELIGISINTLADVEAVSSRMLARVRH